MEQLLIVQLLWFALFTFLAPPAALPSEWTPPAATAQAQDLAKATSAAKPDEADSLVLADGTPIPFKVVNGFSSESAKVGDVINFAVAFEIREGGLVVVPQRTTLVGKVVTVSRPRRGARSGQVNVAFDGMTLPTGETATVRSILKPPRKAAKAAQNAANGAADAAGLFFTAGLPLLLLFEKGDEQVVKEGTIEVLYLNGPLHFSRRAITEVQPDSTSAYANVFVQLIGKLRRTEYIVPELYCGEKRIVTYRGEPLRLQMRPGSYWFSTNDPKDRPIRMEVIAGREYSVGSDQRGFFAKELPAHRRYYPSRLADEDWTKLPPEEYRSLAAEPAKH
ncbi:MAG TPA: hypothetical protein VJN89_11075 [Candidatus Acidoferrum sp.]|nr:hypothetical protein [Candidatus Acidoferrum sp.]